MTYWHYYLFVALLFWALCRFHADRIASSKWKEEFLCAFCGLFWLPVILGALLHEAFRGKR